MPCVDAYAGFEDFATFWCISIAESEEAHVNRMLQLAATPIHASRAASGGCDCTVANWVNDYLMMLNCILAATTYNCKCSNLSLTIEEKRLYMEVATADLELIRVGKIELCAGETGAEFPWTGWAEQGWTEANRAQIIVNDTLRNS